MIRISKILLIATLVFTACSTEDDGPAVTGARGKATISELTAEVSDLRNQLQPSDTIRDLQASK